MHNEVTDRQMAIRRRLVGESVETICRSLHHAQAWFHKWWPRYRAEGQEGLYDLTRANQQVLNRTPPHIERAVISTRRRLAARATPQTRYSLVGAVTIRAELKAWGYMPLPALRTIEAVVARAGLTCPPLRLARRLAQSDDPGLVARDANEVHQVDVVGPRRLFGHATDYYFLICRDVFDGADYMEWVVGRERNTVIEFLIHAWQRLGLPEPVQFDPVVCPAGNRIPHSLRSGGQVASGNGREFCGFGQAARWLSRVIRFCLRVGVGPVFIPPGQPQRNGAIEHSNGWFQPLRWGRRLRHLMETTNEQQVRPALGFKTAAQYRRSKRLRTLPDKFPLDTGHLPVATGSVAFIRLVTAAGAIDVLEQAFKVGQRLKFQWARPSWTCSSRS